MKNKTIGESKQIVDKIDSNIECIIIRPNVRPHIVKYQFYDFELTDDNNVIITKKLYHTEDKE